MAPDLHAEVEKLRQWRAAYRCVDQYEGWWPEDGVIGALQHFLTQLAPQYWSERDVTDLLYLLEQSSTAYAVELITRDEEMALAIAGHSLARGGVAGDDIAEQLQHCSRRRDEAETLLLAFARDAHERTRRMALLSLARMRSEQVPALAEAAWNTGDEYARMGALSALKIIGSTLFPAYLLRAREDGRTHLLSLARQYANALHEGRPAAPA